VSEDPPAADPDHRGPQSRCLKILPQQIQTIVDLICVLQEHGGAEYLDLLNAIVKVDDARQSLACSPPGPARCLPLANSSETSPITDCRSAEHCHHLANVVKLTPVMIDACCTHSNVVNCGVTGTNLTKFLHSVEKSFSEIAIAILQSI